MRRSGVRVPPGAFLSFSSCTIKQFWNIANLNKIWSTGKWTLHVSFVILAFHEFITTLARICPFSRSLALFVLHFIRLSLMKTIDGGLIKSYYILSIVSPGLSQFLVSFVQSWISNRACLLTLCLINSPSGKVVNHRRIWQEGSFVR